jgi:hypothetical protein
MIMKKAVLIGMLLFAGSKVFSQAGEVFTEEKSTGWIRISMPEKPVVRRAARQGRTPAAPVNEAPVQQPAPEQKPSNAFDKTNKQVKRFKKGN